MDESVTQVWLTNRGPYRRAGDGKLQHDLRNQANFDVIKTMEALENRLDDIREPMDVAVIGCIVNGPGEAKVADMGLTGGTPKNLLYIDGKPFTKIKPDNLIEDLEQAIRAKAEEKSLAREQLIASDTATPKLKND